MAAGGDTPESGSDPVEVARRANQWWGGVPFGELRLALVEEPSFEAGMARLERLGYGSVAELIDPDVELDLSGFPGGETLPSGRGREVWRAFWREWTEAWESLTIEHGNYEAYGEHVLTDVHVTGRGGASGAEVGLDMVQLWTIRSGRIAGYAVFTGREDALAAAGVESSAK